MTIWLAGECDHPDFASAAAWLRANCQVVDLAASPGAIVLFQSRPGSIARGQVELLHRRAPLARLILLCGACCDGELHRRELIPGVVRIRWHQWRQRLFRELSGLLPRTSSDGERLEQDLRGLAKQFDSGGTVAIRTECRATHQCLADACQALGLGAVWHAPGEAADALLIDGWTNDFPPQSEARAPRRILLLDFPRPEDIARAADLRFAAVIAQPLLLADLAAALQGTVVPSREAACRVA
jgi:hypothetical protein